MRQQNDPDAPEWVRDEERELSSAEFTSPNLVDNIDTAAAKHRIVAQAIEAKVKEVKPMDAEKYATQAAVHTARLCQTFSMAAVQTGPRGQDRAILQFISSRKTPGSAGGPQ